MKNLTNNKSAGISLIVLVITIIVIIILSAAIILSINDNNPIESARRAKQKHNESVYQEELSLYIINKYSDKNNTGFNKNTFNIFEKEEIKSIITSMAKEDMERCIIWQGELVVKDGDIYRYINGEKVKTFDDRTVTTNMIEFAKAIKSTDLLYNGGYITNLKKINVENLKGKLPENIVIKNYNLSSDKGNTYYIGTDDGIYYNGELVARTVVFGDINLTTSSFINDNDVVTLNELLFHKGEGYSIGQIIASDVNDDGFIDRKDYEMLNSDLFSIPTSDLQNHFAEIPSF